MQTHHSYSQTIKHQVALAILIMITTAVVLIAIIPLQSIKDNYSLQIFILLLTSASGAWFGLRHECRGPEGTWSPQFAWLPRFVGKTSPNGWPHFVWLLPYERLVVIYKDTGPKGSLSYHIERQPRENSQREGDSWLIPATYERNSLL